MESSVSASRLPRSASLPPSTAFGASAETTRSILPPVPPKAAHTCSSIAPSAASSCAPPGDGMDNRRWLLNHWKNIHEKPKPRRSAAWRHRKDLPLHTCPYCAGEAPRNAHGEEVLSAYCPHCGQPLGY